MVLKVRGEDSILESVFAFYLIFLFTLIFSFFLDFFTKKLAVSGILNVKVLYNFGGSFSIGDFQSLSIFYSAFSILAICILLIFLIKLRKFISNADLEKNKENKGFCYFLFFDTKQKNLLFYSISVGLLAGGILGNLVDRIINPPYFFKGYIIDFINYFGFVTGNVADIFIVVVVFVFIILLLKKNLK